MERADAIILARVSSKSQEDEGYSLDSQLKLLTGYCDKKGLAIVKVFKIAETASKEQGRKIFHEMLEYIEKNEVTHLAVEKTDRFTRNFRDAVAIDDWLEQNESRRLHAVKEGLILHKNASSDVKFMWSIHVSVAKKYTDNLREEAMKGWREKLAQGWLPAPPPPGYKTVVVGSKRIHVIDPETKSMIQRMFNLYLEPSHSIASVADEMRLMGLRTRKGRPYYKSQVQRILNNPFYVGINRFNGKEYPGAQEKLISKELFNRVQTKMHKGRPVVLKKHNPVFKNIITCNSCNGLVTWQKQKGRYYGSCQRRSEACKKRKFIREDKIEELITKQLSQLICPAPEIIDWVANVMRSEYETDINSQEKLTASMQLQIDRVQRMDDSLYDDKLSGEITPERYKEKHRQLQEQKTELSEQLNNMGTLSRRVLEYDLAILELTQRASSIYSKKTPEQKRLIITKLFTNLIFTDDGISVNYTDFAKVIAENVQLTRKILGE
jgi:site-specific DNA recombinase